MKKFITIFLFISYSVIVYAENLVNSNKLFDWAEQKYPQYFSPSGIETSTYENYLIRYYFDTNIYLGTSENNVYVYGDVFNGLLHVGRISDYITVNTVEISNNNTWYKPPVSASWHWQLSGEINSNHPVDIYDIDLFNSSEQLISNLQSSGKKIICYFSAGSYENFRSDKDKFLKSDLGEIMDGWEDEKWLDIRTENVKNIMKERLDLASEKGCDGVEPDNMDGYINNTGFDLTGDDQITFNKIIANEAHNRGLSIGLKNDLDQISELVDYFDFSVNEQCHEYSECDSLSTFIKQGKPVFNAEYLDKYVIDVQERNMLCKSSQQLKFSTLVLPLNLDDSFRYSCR